MSSPPPTVCLACLEGRQRWRLADALPHKLALLKREQLLTTCAQDPLHRYVHPSDRAVRRGELLQALDACFRVPQTEASSA